MSWQTPSSHPAPPHPTSTAHDILKTRHRFKTLARASLTKSITGLAPGVSVTKLLYPFSRVLGTYRPPPALRKHCMVPTHGWASALSLTQTPCMAWVSVSLHVHTGLGFRNLGMMEKGGGWYPTRANGNSGLGKLWRECTALLRATEYTKNTYPSTTVDLNYTVDYRKTCWFLRDILHDTGLLQKQLDTFFAKDILNIIQCKAWLLI
jgi:hypothetical protein